MRIYINGRMNEGYESFSNDKVFLPLSIHFSNDECDDDTIPSKNCVILDGIECDCTWDKNKFSCRWKGVDFHQDEGHERVQLLDLIDSIDSNGLRITNLSGCIDGNVIVTIDSILIEDILFNVELNNILFNEPIEFV